ncbi:MAG: GNAT family N-acetyltransferase [Alphaproteobacteria bacterium]|nr:GNAT family N-acetyltransferase [Alphaproteobacteria bacterium]
MGSGHVSEALGVVKEDAVLARSRSLSVRLALNEAEIEAAQRLRFEVFYREMNAKPSPEMAATGRDFDRFDPVCDHLLVIDDADGTPQVVGCYRLLRREVAEATVGFYTSDEYDIAAMLARRGPARDLELGRSCVLKSHRTSPTMTLLWRGLLAYLLSHEIELMFGCASLPGTDPAALALELSYLHHFHLAPPDVRVRAQPERFVSMNILAKEQVNEAEALRKLPPLMKGYLRAGAYIGEGAVIDHQFGTTDVFIYFPTARIDPRYVAHFKKRPGATDGA